MPGLEFHPVKTMKASYYEQSFPTWGLDRLDQTDLPLDRKFKYPEHAGEGANVYIIDTGITPHTQFEKRLQPGFSSVGDGTEDCAGHGTHVAGIVAAKSYGVAKKAKLYPVRVLNCAGEGTDETVIAGVNWVAKNAKMPAVANLSLGGEASAPLDAAMVKLVKAGIATAVAAGNESDDACDVSPARVPSVITVGATTKRDTLASFSNYGKCIDILAPGEGILSTYLNGKTAYLSGTSMASPFVAGVLALLSMEMAAPTPGLLEEDMKQQAVWNKINNLQEDTANLLLQVRE
jgi:subtilisin family serine protease